MAGRARSRKPREREPQRKGRNPLIPQRTAQQRVVRAEGVEPSTFGSVVGTPPSQTCPQVPVAPHPQNPVPETCHEPSISGGSVDLSAALRALASAGLPEPALRAAIKALLGAANPEEAPPAQDAGAE